MIFLKKILPLLLSILLLTCPIMLACAEPIDQLITNGRIALQQKNKSAAITALTNALEQNPNNPEALFYMGVLHYYAHNNSTALSYLQRCYAQHPKHAQYLNAYVTVANHMGQFDCARDLIESNFGAEPQETTLRTKLLPLYIRSMDWYYASKLCRTSDLWWYNEDISNQTVLLDLSSQWNGHGDVMQIIRYARHLHTAGARVSVYVRPEMVALLSLCPYIEDVIATTHHKPALEKEYTLTTDRLTLIMHDTLHSPSQDIPYLYADQSRCEQWKKKLAFYPTLKVGICFQSSPMRDYFSNTIIPGPRSMQPEEIAPLLTVPGISFFSLHMGNDSAVKKLCRYPTFHVFDELDTDYGPFMDTAAVIKQLDLVITVDTSIAHLAGALGVPVWTMVPYAGDFRWFASRSDSPWYPTMTLFRQAKQGEWSDVILRVKEALQSYLFKK